MAACKRPAPDAAHATTTQGPATSSKRSRISIGSIEEYEDRTPIGEGGYGVVLKARHRVTGNTVAIKCLSSPDDSAGLVREARFLVACRGNPYAVGFEGLVRDPATGALCLVMEHVPAESLHTILWNGRHGPPLSERTVRVFMWKLLTGAKMMHDGLVVHRDIKPANILIGPGGKIVKICDFGLALSMVSDLPPYAQAGTAGYMAPEMLLQKPDYDAQVDMWSLGCVMGAMLTGGTLFLDDEVEDESIDEMLQLSNIFRVLGMPDKTTWPEFRSLPLAAQAMRLLPARHKHSRLREIFPEEKLSEQGFELLQGLLTCNPDKRLTAAKALKHPWFSAPPPRPSAAAAAKAEAMPLPTKKTQRFVVPLAALKAQRV
ncbi:unnamed protein product [Alopecurus aequalis]